LPEVRAALQLAPAQTPAATVIAINPFRSAAVPDAPQTNETDAELADTTANLRLFGTWLDAEGGSAIVSGPDEKQIRVKPGDEIAPGVSLESVHREHVVILRSGVREALRLARGLDRSGAAAVPASARPTAPSGVAVPSGMRAVDNGGRGVNIVVEGGVDPQLLASLGLEAGDVIVAIDNRPVRENVAETFGMIRGKATVPATVVRNGLTMTVELKVIDAMRLAAPMDTQALSEEVE
jgi:type II secretory pathway component PulC